MLESQLRQQERAMRDLNEELGKSRATTTSLVMENQVLRGVSPTGAPEPAKAPIKAIEFGRGTGGVDEDRLMGDEILQVVVEPKDVDGHTVKAPGSLTVRACEILPEGTKQPIGQWDLDPEKLRKAYKSGLFQSGYVLILPWQTPPTREKVKLTAQFKLETGQVFEAEKDLKVQVPVGLQVSPPTSVQVLPAIPSGTPGILPPPTTQSSPATLLPVLPAPFGPPSPGGAGAPKAPGVTDTKETPTQTQLPREPSPRPIATSVPVSQPVVKPGSDVKLPPNPLPDKIKN